MSSLEMIKIVYEIGAFTPLYRKDLDVDVTKVHHYVHLKQDVQNQSKQFITQTLKPVIFKY